MINQSNSIKVFGGPYTDQASKASGSTASQDNGEAITAGTTVSRRVRGPKGSGAMSYHLRVTEASAGGTVTVTYSNLPNPDVDNAAHWFADSAPISHVLTGIATFGGLLTGKRVEWVRYSVNPTGDNASVFLYHTGEGLEQ